MTEPRSHIEGATPGRRRSGASASSPTRSTPASRPVLLDRRIPVDDFLDARHDRGPAQPGLSSSGSQIAARRAGARRQADLPAAEVTPARREHRAQPGRARAGQRRVRGPQEARPTTSSAKAATAEPAARPTEAEALRGQAAALHSPPIAVEMTFNVYRTTKGRIGEPVYAEIEVDQPPHRRRVHATSSRSSEYYTNKQVHPAPSSWPARAATCKIEVRCISPTQYLGMAESDLYLLASVGQLRRQLHEGPVRHLAPGHGPDGHRRLRRHVPELAGGAADDHRLLRRRPGRLRLPGRFHPPGHPGRRAVRVADPAAHARQPDDRPGPDRWRSSSPRRSTRWSCRSCRCWSTSCPTSRPSTSATPWPTASPSAGRLIGANTLLALAYALPFSIAGYFILKNREVAA